MLLVRDILEEMSDHIGGQGIDIDCAEESKNEALKVFNEAQRLLMRRGEWDGIDRTICLSVSCGCITLDRRIQTIKQYLINNQPGRVLNDNFKYLQTGAGTLDASQWQSGATLEDVGDHFATVCDLPYGMFITAWSDRPETDATLEIFGTDDAGREVSRHWLDDKGFTIPIHEKGCTSPGFTGNDTHSSGKLVHIHALKKSRTNGYVYVYGYLPCGEDTYEMQWLVTLAPDETESRHRRYKVPGASSDCVFDMTAKVSMRWVRQYMNDVALIQNIDAFNLMARALNARDANELGLYSELRNRAVAELKLDIAKKHPAHGNFLNVKGHSPIRNSSTRYSHYNK